jgi:AraC-like DNA-binding protein
MNKANGALRSSDATIADVAERAGYDSESSFCRAFKRWLGRSPAAFRGTRGGDTPGAKTSISTVGTSAEHFED